MQPTAVRVPVARDVSLRVLVWSPGPVAGTPAAGTPAGGPPFLLVHGLSSNARLWEGVATRLAAAGHPAYAVDLRSHGGSDAPPDGYDTATAAADLDAVCAGLRLGPAVVAGQSWGGDVVVRFAARFPARVLALALIDGGWRDLRAGFDSWERCAVALRPAEMDGTPAERVRDFIRGAHPHWQPWAIEATLGNFAVDGDGGVSRRLPIPRHMRILRSIWDDPPVRYHAAVRVPTLLLRAAPRSGGAGRPSGPHPAGRDEELLAAAASALGEAIIRQYPDADHDVHAERPDEVADDLLELLAKVRPT